MGGAVTHGTYPRGFALVHPYVKQRVKALDVFASGCSTRQRHPSHPDRAVERALEGRCGYVTFRILFQTCFDCGRERTM